MFVKQSLTNLHESWINRHTDKTQRKTRRATYKHQRNQALLYCIKKFDIASRQMATCTVKHRPDAKRDKLRCERKIDGLG